MTESDLPEKPERPEIKKSYEWEYSGEFSRHWALRVPDWVWAVVVLLLEISAATTVFYIVRSYL